MHHFREFQNFMGSVFFFSLQHHEMPGFHEEIQFTSVVGYKWSMYVLNF